MAAIQRWREALRAIMKLTAINTVSNSIIHNMTAFPGAIYAYVLAKCYENIYKTATNKLDPNWFVELQDADSRPCCYLNRLSAGQV